MTRLRAATLLPGSHPGSRSGFTSLDGSVPREGGAARRRHADSTHWPARVGGGGQLLPLPADPGPRWVGLTELFSIEDGRWPASMPDGVVQRKRVAATNGLRVDELVRPDARLVGRLGAGWQAGSQVRAVAPGLASSSPPWGRVLRRARELGLGHGLPDDWLTQTVQP